MQYRLGFRINLYEKDGQTKLVYSTMDDLFDENDRSISEDHQEE